MVYAGKELQNLIERYVSYVQLQGVNIEQVWIHGAHADGMPTRWDFIDLAIMSPDFTGAGIFQVMDGLRRALSLMPESARIRIEAYHAWDYIEPAKEIRSNGRLVWEAHKPLQVV